MQELKTGETDILDLIRATLRTLCIPDSVSVRLHSGLADTAVHLDGERIEKMLIDLLRNAVEAMSYGGDLTVTLSGDGEGIEIVIEDTGIGIPPENMDQLFTPFFTTKPPGDGTGLGLPSAYVTVKAHGGAMGVHSNADLQKGPTGTHIRISLPKRSVHEYPMGRTIVHED